MHGGEACQQEHLTTCSFYSLHTIPDRESTDLDIGCIPTITHIHPSHFEALPSTISPPKCYYDDLLAQPPTTPYEFQLQAALQESEARNRSRKTLLVDMQATVLL